MSLAELSQNSILRPSTYQDVRQLDWIYRAPSVHVCTYPGLIGQTKVLLESGRYCSLRSLAALPSQYPKVMSWDSATMTLRPHQVRACRLAVYSGELVYLNATHTSLWSRNLIGTPTMQILTATGMALLGDLSCQARILGKGRFFNPFQASVAIGSFLGDGHLARIRGSRYRLPRLELTQGEEQLEYLKYKIACFGDLIRADPYRYLSSMSPRPCWQVKMLGVEQLRDWLPFSFQNNRKVLTNTLLDLLDDLALSIFYLDDGHLNKGGSSPRVSLHLEDYNVESQQVFRDWLRRRFGGGVSINKKRHQYYISLNKDESARFLDAVEKLIPPVMSYKHRVPNQARAVAVRNRYHRVGSVPVKYVERRQLSYPVAVYRLSLDGADNFISSNLVVRCASL
jgi:LAGLIDADG DNA endonuclease family protein